MKREVVHPLAIFFAAYVTGAYAVRYEGGDLGQPPDYDQTIRKRESAYEAQLPAEFSWATRGMVTPAENQGMCSSWAFITVSALESKILIKGLPRVGLSDQQLFPCQEEAAGCCRGGMRALLAYGEQGPISEECAPYTEMKTACPAISGMR